MNTLLLRLVAPMQSWGVQSHFDIRDTGREPSKSGVIGLLCAALGRPRDAPLEDLAALPMAVRVDREGEVAVDFQNAQDVLRAVGGLKPTEISQRYYLADAAFLVGLAGDLALLQTLHAALRNPVWSLYLGRKAFVPGESVWLPDGLRPGEDLQQALATYPWVGRREDDRPEQVRVVSDDPDGTEVRYDLPVSFARRAFLPRRVRTTMVTPRWADEEAG